MSFIEENLAVSDHGIPRKYSNLSKSEQIELRNDLPESCCKCRYWEEFEPPILSEVDTSYDLHPLVAENLEVFSSVEWSGQCKRHSPVIDPEDRSRPDWPQTLNFDWCGDFETRV